MIKRARQRTVTRCLAFVWLWSQGLAHAAEALPDPTRPPAEMSMTGGVAASGPVLQSVMLAPGRRNAVIGGQLLREGDTFGEAKLIKISESEVVLSGPDGEQVLRLFPDVEKIPARAPAATRQRGSPQPERSERKAP